MNVGIKNEFGQTLVIIALSGTGFGGGPHGQVIGHTVGLSGTSRYVNFL